MEERIKDIKCNFYATKARMADVVEAMHTIVAALNDETAYYDRWIWLVPDGATREDFEYIAESPRLLTDTIDTFKDIVNDYIEQDTEED